MGLFSKDIQSMDDLYLHTLEDIYYAEQQIVKALPKMMDKASSDTLRQAFEAHLQETKGQIERLEEVFALLGKDPKGVTCPAIDGIIKEANEISKEIADAQVLDAALAAAAQAVEHYEITRYGTLIAWSREMGRTSCADILQQTLDEENATDRKLTEIATTRLNPAA
ncbi:MULTISPECIES: ferritin-like domain-containing protein [unclassified Yoonia]|uniref:YciE/YciF ferroxidase family protein n=1 Tax=unclassified Yoonia TaxID=2629118 RepID=UPI002AFE3813|nr:MULTISPECIES: ferritin-like domain-containing protein [unclassified Yoonia]